MKRNSQHRLTGLILFGFGLVSGVVFSPRILHFLKDLLPANRLELLDPIGGFSLPIYIGLAIGFLLWLPFVIADYFQARSIVTKLGSVPFWFLMAVLSCVATWFLYFLFLKSMAESTVSLTSLFKQILFIPIALLSAAAIYTGFLVQSKSSDMTIG